MKPLDRYALQKNKKSGYHSQCKDCRNLKFAKAAHHLTSVSRYQKYKKKEDVRLKARLEYGTPSSYACAVLNCKKNAQNLHHVDYDFAYDVIPLCVNHHKMEHARIVLEKFVLNNPEENES